MSPADATGAVDWDRVREDFPILAQEVNGRPLAYLDSAASSQRPRQVLEALDRYYRRDHANVHRGIHELSNRATQAYEGARARAARFLGSEDPREVVFVRGTTEAINLVASTWGRDRIGAGDRIVLSEMEHHSNLVPWQILARRTGAEIAWCPVVGDGEALDEQALDRLLAPPTRLLSLVHISNSLGLVNPVARICARARQQGVATLIDGAQAAGHAPVDVRELGCDFYAFSGHKMCGPTGIGVLWGRRELLEALPPWQGGGEMIEEVTFEQATYKPPPHRFEAGTPHIAGAIGLHAAMDYLDGLGRENIRDHDAVLAARAAEAISGMEGIRVFGPRKGRGAVVSFHMEDVHAHDLVAFADSRGVALRGGHHCTQPLMRKLGVSGTARASFHLYNRSEEIDILMDTLERARKLFGSRS